MRSLTLAEARERAELHLRDVVCRRARPRPGCGGLRLGLEHRASRAALRVPTAGSTSRRDRSRLDHAQRDRSSIPPRSSTGGCRSGALPRQNVLVVAATMAYSHDGQGLHRATDPADQRDYVYGHLFLDAAPSVYACFDQPDLKAPYDIDVRAPQEWIVHRQRRRDRVGPVVAGHVAAGDDEAARDLLRDRVRRAVRLRARRARRHTRSASMRAPRCDEPLERHAAEIFDVTKRSLRLLPRALRHPLPLRGVPPGLRAGVQRRRDGEPRLRHLPRPVPLPRGGDPRRAADAGPTPSATRCRTCGSATSSR